MSYGTCPKCGSKGISRERRIDGNDRCEKGHVYPSKNSIPVGSSLVMKKPYTMIKCPVRYERRGTYIFDADDNMVANVRGWGRISYMEAPGEKQDKMGEFIAQAINEKLFGSDYDL